MKIRVLVIEDEEELRDLICEFFTMEKMQAVPAAHGKQALEILAQDSNFDLVVMDWNMPVMNGESFLALAPEIPTIVLSANRPRLPQRCLYLEKPFMMAQLMNMIEITTGKRSELRAK